MKRVDLVIEGMHCHSCEVLIEHAWKALPGVQRVHVNQVKGRAKVDYDEAAEPDIAALAEAVRSNGYVVRLWEDGHKAAPKNTGWDYFEMAMIAVILLLAYLIFKELGLVPKNFGVSEDMSLWAVLGIGLIAAFSSCIAVTGGLLLAVTSAHAERHPELSGWQKFKPTLYFNAGRVVFYGLLGAATGALGSTINLSARSNATLLFLVAVVMLMLGFRLLHLFPWLSVGMPKVLAHRIHDYSRHEHPLAPFLLGGATFFLPCGFTQALQLYVLARGDFKLGAVLMFVFAIGTLPALLSISAISSYAKGAFQHYFLRTAGVLIVIIAVFNLRAGLALAGLPGIGSWFRFAAVEQADGVLAPVTDGKQIVRMTVSGVDYVPSRFKVRRGIPVEWQITADEPAGCGRILIASKIGVRELLPEKGPKTITFTPLQTGFIDFNCSMGMMTPGSGFEVVD